MARVGRPAVALWRACVAACCRRIRPAPFSFAAPVDYNEPFKR